MKRAAIVLVSFASSLIACAQDPGAAGADAKAQPRDPVDAVLTAMQEAEAKLTSIRITMSTRMELPGGLTLTTEGTMHVLLGAQPKSHVALQYSFGDGMRGRSESDRKSTRLNSSHSSVSRMPSSA